jgi:hypothetical protein
LFAKVLLIYIEQNIKKYFREHGGPKTGGRSAFTIFWQTGKYIYLHIFYQLIKEECVRKCVFFAPVMQERVFSEN